MLLKMNPKTVVSLFAKSLKDFSEYMKDVEFGDKGDRDCVDKLLLVCALGLLMMLEDTYGDGDMDSFSALVRISIDELANDIIVEELIDEWLRFSEELKHDHDDQQIDDSIRDLLDDINKNLN